jgi:hypothetical protein
VFQSGIEGTEERISALEDRTIEIMLREHRTDCNGTCVTNKRHNIPGITVLEGE